MTEIVDNPAESAATLNSDLQCVVDLPTEWIVKFSAPKTKTMQIAKQTVMINQSPPVSIYMGGSPVDEIHSPINT